MTKTETAFVELNKVVNLLSHDTGRSIEIYKQNRDNFSERTFIRTMSSFLEGIMFQLRQVSIVASEDLESEFTSEELVILKEEKYFLDKKGNVEIRDNYQNLLPMLLFSFNCYARIHGIEFKPDISNHGWEALKKYIIIRNQMMHPKSLLDLTMDYEKLKITQEAFSWLSHTLADLFEICNKENVHYKVV